MSGTPPDGPRGATDRRHEVPARMRLNREIGTLSIDWHDGHASVYRAAYLRFLCPCAGCRGHAPGDVIPPSWEQVRGVGLTGGSPVGGYALNLQFSDGHASGLYAFDRLRAACPCGRCGAKDPTDGGPTHPRGL